MGRLQAALQDVIYVDKDTTVKVDKPIVCEMAPLVEPEFSEEAACVLKELKKKDITTVSQEEIRQRLLKSVYDFHMEISVACRNALSALKKMYGGTTAKETSPPPVAQHSAQKSTSTSSGSSLRSSSVKEDKKSSTKEGKKKGGRKKVDPDNNPGTPDDYDRYADHRITHEKILEAAKKNPDIHCPKQAEEDEPDQATTFNPRLEVHLEDDNFIARYIKYAKTTSDAYEEYHFAAGLMLVSVAADRILVVSMRHGNIFPNIWIFGLGDSTVSRKSTAFKLLMLFLNSKYLKKRLPQSFSPEALLAAMANMPQSYLTKDEAGGLLAALKKEYMSETRDILADIYECNDFYRKTKKEEIYIEKPYITQFMMTTPDNLKEYSSPLDLRSGWLVRYLWFCPNYPKEWKPYSQKTDDDDLRFEYVYGIYTSLADRIQLLKGPQPRRLTLTDEAFEYFQTWQRDLEEKAMQDQDNVTKALAGRLETNVLKMAALFTIGRADFNGDSQIELGHIKEACRLALDYFLPVGKIIAEDVGRAEDKNVQDRILGILKRHNGLMSERELRQNLHMKINEVDDNIDALVDSDEVKKVLKKAKNGVPQACLRLNNRGVTV